MLFDIHMILPHQECMRGYVSYASKQLMILTELGEFKRKNNFNGPNMKTTGYL